MRFEPIPYAQLPEASRSCLGVRVNLTWKVVDDNETHIGWVVECQSAWESRSAYYPIGIEGAVLDNRRTKEACGAYLAERYDAVRLAVIAEEERRRVVETRRQLDQELVSEDGNLPREFDTEHPNAPANCACEPCKMRRFEDHSLFGGTVIDYSAEPRGGWKLHSLPDDQYNYHLGVELETDSYYTVPATGERVQSDVPFDTAIDMARPEGFWVAKRDGSVTGPEFCSHPATLAWWIKNKKKIREMLTMLVHAGYRSYDNDKAGMHVSFSRCALNDKAHLNRLLTLIHSDRKWAIRMSQRSLNSMHYAKLDEGDTESGRNSIVNQVYSQVDGRGGLRDRQCALNSPHNEARFEFRLPRGTLRLDRFYKNLEWVVSMIEFTRNSTLGDCKPEQYTQYVFDNVKVYPNLVSFIRERQKFLISRTTVVAA